MSKEKTKAAGHKAAGHKAGRGIPKPRRRMDYDRESFVKGESRTFQNDYTLNTKVARVRLEIPRKEGLMTARFWPARNPDHPERLERGRISPHPWKGHGGWLQPVHAVNMIGLGKDNKFTFLLYPPDATEEEKKMNPVAIFLRAVNQAFGDGTFPGGKVWNGQWNKYMQGGKGRGADIPKKVGTLWFGQGVCYANGEKDYLKDREVPMGQDAGDELLIIRLSNMAGRLIQELFAREKPDGFDGDEEKIPTLPYLYGDPVGVPSVKEGIVKGGWFYNLWNPDKIKYTPKGATTWTGKKREFQSVETEIVRTIKAGGNTYGPGMTAEEVEVALDKSKFWFDSQDGTEPGLLYFPSVEEQCVLLARAIAEEPKLLMAAWMDHPELLSKDVKDILAQRSQAVVPGQDDEEDYEDEEVHVGKGKKKHKDPTVAEEPEDEEFEDDEFENEEFEEEPIGGDEDDEEDEFADEESEDEESEDEESEDEESEDEESEDEESEDEESEDEESEDEESEDEESEDEESEDEESEDEESEDEESEDEEDYFGDGGDPESEDEESEDEESEDEAAAAEFDPDEEISAKDKKTREKMKESLDKAKGRSKKRTSAQAPAPPAAPKSKATKKATKAPAKSAGKKKTGRK